MGSKKQIATARCVEANMEHAQSIVFIDLENARGEESPEPKQQPAQLSS
ncbi:hypothetical protein HNW13_023295 [Shewanella sp. BF02_Schw]|nr:hypothetical protein [Shewanella sp. BF02_Schw]MBO1898667.1 hypothetical protein [Shewanella sp. BF02_Schw]